METVSKCQAHSPVTFDDCEYARRKSLDVFEEPVYSPQFYTKMMLILVDTYYLETC